MKNKKGYTLVEVVVSFSLIMIVMIYLLKTIIVVSEKNTELLSMQEFTVYESSLLDKVYNDIDNLIADNVSITQNSDSIVFNDIDKILEFNKTDKTIIYNNVIYKLPDSMEFDNTMFSVSTFSKGYIITVNLILNDTNQKIYIVYQGNHEE